MIRRMWLVIAGVQLAMAAINVPGALGGSTGSWMALGFCAALALVSVVQAVFWWSE